MENEIKILTDLTIAIFLEASELLEAFLWKKPEEAKVEKVKEDGIRVGFRDNDDFRKYMIDTLEIR